MRVIQAAPHYPPTFLGGVELYAQRLADWLATRGCAVTVVAVERTNGVPGSVLAESSSEGGVGVVRLSFAGGDGGRHGLSLTYAPEEVEAWWDEALVSLRPDVVHLHSGYLYGGAMLAAASRANVPVVLTLHDYWFICPRVTLLHPDGGCCTGPDTAGKCAWCLATSQRRYRLPDRALGGLLSRRVPWHLDTWRRGLPGALSSTRRAIEARRHSLARQLETAAVVLSPSNFLRAQFDRAGFAADRIRVHRLGVAPRRRVGRPRRDGPLRAGFLGQVAPHKGVHVLVDAVRRLAGAPIEVRIHGDLGRDVAYTEALRKAIDDDGRIDLAGPVTHAELDDLFGRLDVLVVPSVWYENSPFSILEAQAAGIPVVASRLGGMAELVRDGQDGLLFEMGNAEDLARQLARLANEPGLLERLAAAAPAVPSIDDEFASLFRIYEDVVARR